MIFGSISYLNLLPFQLFLKKSLPSQTKQSLHYRRNVPSKINKAFHNRKVNVAFISSVTSAQCKCTNLGIIANGAVRSVFVIQGEDQIDTDSASSNVLAKVLHLQGKVLIGDKALRYYLAGNEATDLALRWKEETTLPFVFARLCYNRYDNKVEKLAKEFSKRKISIPQTILKKEAKAKGITPKELVWYLEHIYYNMDYKAQKSLKLFLRKSRKV